jgi:hypothetical protein
MIPCVFHVSFPFLLSLTVVVIEVKKIMGVVKKDD